MWQVQRLASARQHFHHRGITLAVQRNLPPQSVGRKSEGVEREVAQSVARKAMLHGEHQFCWGNLATFAT